MKVRDVLEALLAGQLTIDQAEYDILYRCDDCTYLECDPESEE
jgi:hypothetical protein